MSIASAGTGRSSGNRLSGVNRCSASSNTSSVLRHAACWLSLISPRYNTCPCATFPDCRRLLSTTVKYRCCFPSLIRVLLRRNIPDCTMPELSAAEQRVGLHYKRFRKCLIYSKEVISQVSSNFAENQSQLRRFGYNGTRP